MEKKLRVSDPIYGSILLDDFERRIVETRVFQRLRRIKQLGIASYVFPSADYSRFAHSLGVCHLSGICLDGLENNSPAIKNDDQFNKSKYRLAALIHDIGHYPFSHTMEDALKSIPEVTEESYDDNIAMADKSRTSGFIKHEKMAHVLMKTDPELSKLIVRNGFDVDELYSIISDKKSGRPPFSKIVSSDLDADRMDYLSRTSSHTGLPYGSVDYNYIANQISLDHEGSLGFKDQALRTIEHLLISRWIEYQQVIYNKTVMGFEAILEKVIRHTIKKSDHKFNEEDCVKKVESDDWKDIDDDWMISHFRKSRKNLNRDSLIDCEYECVIDRIPPKCLLSYCCIRKAGEPKGFDQAVKDVHEHVQKRSNALGLPYGSIFVRVNAPDGNAKGIVTFNEDQVDNKGIRIIRKHDTTSELIHNFNGSIIESMYRKVPGTIRVYCLRSRSLPKFCCDKEDQDMLSNELNEIASQLNSI